MTNSFSEIGDESQREAFVNLRTILSTLYSDSRSARRVAEDAGLEWRLIDSSGAAIDIWNSILREAENSNEMEDIFKVVLRQYGTNPTLLVVIKDYKDRIELRPNIKTAEEGQIPVAPVSDRLSSMFSQASMLELKGDLGGALDIYRTIEAINPLYPGLYLAKKRVEAELDKPYVRNGKVIDELVIEDRQVKHAPPLPSPSPSKYPVYILLLPIGITLLILWLLYRFFFL